MKKIIVLLTALLFVVAIVGCGNFIGEVGVSADTTNYVTEVDVPLGNESEQITDTANDRNEADVTLADGRTFFELSDMDGLTATSADLEHSRFHTNSTQILVSVSYGEYSGTIALHDAYSNEEIQTFILDQHNRAGVFTNLTSAKNYYIIADGFDDTALFTISE